MLDALNSDLELLVVVEERPDVQRVRAIAKELYPG